MAGPFLATGKVTYLRVHEVGTGYGAGTDFLDAEAIVKIDSAPDKSFGFQLRSDPNLPVREEMLGLLRMAYRNDLTVGVEYLIDPGKHNGLVVRTYLRR